MNNNVLVRVENLTKYFPITRGIIIQREIGAIQAVDNVSFDIKKGETLGLVGESGCGKSTTGRTIIQLYQPTSGKVFYKNKELSNLRRGELRQLRRNMQIIFQDPYASLNPRLSVGEIVGEPLEVHGVEHSSKKRRERVQELLRLVGLSPYFINRYANVLALPVP